MHYSGLVRSVTRLMNDQDYRLHSMVESNMNEIGNACDAVSSLLETNESGRATSVLVLEKLKEGL